MKYGFLNIDRIIWILVGLGAIAGIGGLAMFVHGPRISVANQENALDNTSPLTGLPCTHPDRRPITVMISSDPEARPLSGLNAADMVFEMPVTPSGITRMMAVYQCGPEPKEIGSIRSARQDFIPLSQGLHAIFAHWGGEAGALEQLDAHITDNVNALLYDGTVFYRKKGVQSPHNGFSTLALIGEQAGQLGYGNHATITGYPHALVIPTRNMGALVDRVVIPWPGDMAVEYQYDNANNTYARWRGGSPEMDATTHTQVSASVIVIMKTDAHFLHDQYISVRTTGTGEAIVYQDGKQIPAHWKKNGPEDMLALTDVTGHPLSFTPGRIWVEIDAPLPAVSLR